MRRILLMLACFHAFLLFSAVAFANPTAMTVQKKYSTMNSIKAEFTQVLVHKESGSKEVRKGTLYFKKPLLVRWETTSPAPELLLVTSKEIWNVFSDEEIAYKYPLSVVEDSRSIIRVVTGQARLDKDFTVEEQGKEGGMIKLMLYPKEPSQSLIEAILWVDPATHLMKKFRAYDFFGNENEISFANISSEAAIPVKAFSYTPEKGFVVEDRTNDANAVPSRALLQ